MNLTRDEAHTRAQILSAESYTVDLDLTTSTETFESTTTIAFRATPGSSTWVDLVDATLHEVTLNGAPVDLASYTDSRIAINGLLPENHLVVRATLPYSHSGEGLHRFVDPADDRVYLYSQFEVPDARRVYATFEQPDLKSVFSFNVTAPEQWVVVSNAATPEPEGLGDGKAIWRFPTTETMSTYITAIVAGEYYAVFDTYEGKHGAIPLGHYCRQSLKEYLERDVYDMFTITKQGFEFFEDAFGYPYPFGKYDQLYVPEYNMGAMENAGCVTFRDEYLPRSRQTRAFYEARANTILHEMAHMWFGDLVTMKWWDDLWLNESFAEWASHYAAAKATEFSDAWTAFTNARKNWAYRQDQLPSTHPIAADNHDLEAVESNFDGITYAKGASTLKQLVAWVGDEPFLQGLSAYFKSHAFQNSSFSDLLGALERSSGRELTSWATEWLQTSGVNTLRAEFELAEDGSYTRFAIAQTAHPDYPTLRRHRIGIGLYDLTEDRLVRRRYVETDIAGAHTEIAELIGAKQPDLLLINDNDLTYAKIRLDERSLQTLVDGIDLLDDSLARALCWGAAWDMTRDAEMRATDFVALVLRGIGQERDLTAVGALLGYARTAADLYSAPGHRIANRARWEAGVRELLAAAEPSSDHQLAFARAMCAAASSEEALGQVRGLYEGTVDVPGLAIDQDMRWNLLSALAANRWADDAEIDAELARDATISGAESAASARASMPTPEAKEHAWQLGVISKDTPNETARQICLSFQRSGQTDVLEPYVERYFEMAEHILETRGVWLARIALEYTFPRANPTPETLDRADRWLAETSAPPAAKRYVSEGRADLARALAAQERDGS
jgi:aminopeptidase N